MKYKVRNRKEFKKIQSLFPDRIVSYNSSAKLIDVENRSDTDEVLIEKISRLLNHRQEEYVRDDIIFILKSLSLGTPIEPYVLALIKHYKVEIDLYTKNGSDDFLNAVNNEPTTLKDADGNDILDVDGNPQPNPYYIYLEIVVEAPSTEYPTGKKVRHSIVEQIT